MSTNNSSNYSQSSISTTTTLGSSTYGTTVVCTGSSGYTVTLPAAVANQWIEFDVRTTSNALITLSPPSGTIDGQSTVMYGTYEGCRLFTDGTNWFTVYEKLQPVIARYYLGSAQNLTTSAAAIQYNTIAFDIGSFFNTSTYEYTPLYYGKYQVNFQYTALNGASAQQFYGTIIKNSTAQALISPSIVANYNAVIEGQVIINMNGVSDYIYVNGYVGSTTTALTTGVTLSYVEFVRVTKF